MTDLPTEWNIQTEPIHGGRKSYSHPYPSPKSARRAAGRA
jgi:hypothetical protein